MKLRTKRRLEELGLTQVGFYGIKKGMTLREVAPGYKSDKDNARFFRRLLKQVERKSLTLSEEVAKVRQAEKKGRK